MDALLLGLSDVYDAVREVTATAASIKRPTAEIGQNSHKQRQQQQQQQQQQKEQEQQQEQQLRTSVGGQSTHKEEGKKWKPPDQFRRWVGVLCFN